MRVAHIEPIREKMVCEKQEINFISQSRFLWFLYTTDNSSFWGGGRVGVGFFGLVWGLFSLCVCVYCFWLGFWFGFFFLSTGCIEKKIFMKPLWPDRVFCLFFEICYFRISQQVEVCWRILACLGLASTYPKTKHIWKTK